MGQIASQLDYAFRDFSTDGIAASKAAPIKKFEVRKIGPIIEAQIANAALAGGDLEAAEALIAPLLGLAEAARDQAQSANEQLTVAIADIPNQVAGQLSSAVAAATADATTQAGIATAKAAETLLARDQAADLVVPENTFVAADLATARASGEAAVAEGTYFRAVGSAEGEAETRLRTSGGSALLYRENTKSAFSSSDPDKGASFVQTLRPGTVQDFVRGRIPSVTDIDPTIAIDGTGDQAAKLNAVLDGTYPDVLFTAEHHIKVNGQITPARSVNIHAELGAHLDGGGATGSFPDDAVLCAMGAVPVKIPGGLALGTYVRGSVALQFAGPHGLAVGDLFMIYNPTDGSYNAARANYRAGEYCEVITVDSPTEVTLARPLVGSYASADVDIYKVADPYIGDFGPLKVTAPGAGANAGVMGILVRHCRDNIFDRTYACGSGHASFVILNAYKATGRVFGDQWLPGDGGTQYGCVVGSSYIESLTGIFRGWRHGIAQGGDNHFSIPTRARIHNFVATNHPSQSGISAADWHGDSEDCVYEDGVCVNGGLNCAGDRNTARSIKIYGGVRCIGILGRELKGFSHTFDDIELVTSINDASRGALCDIGGNSIASGRFTTRGGTLRMSRIRVEAINQTGPLTSVRNRGTYNTDESQGAAPSINFSVVIDDVEAIAPSISNATVVSSVSGSAAQRVQVTNLRGTGNKRPLVLGAPELARPTLVRQDTQTGTDPINVTTATGDHIGSIENFPWEFAKPPQLIFDLSDVTTDAVDRVVATRFSVSEAARRFRVTRCDQAANFGQAKAFDISWTARLWE